MHKCLSKYINRFIEGIKNIIQEKLTSVAKSVPFIGSEAPKDASMMLGFPHTA